MPDAPLKNAPILSLPELQARLGEFYKAVDEFNEGFYFESHETLEDLWMVTPWPERQFFQGIIQLAAALVHFARREYPGVIKLLDAAAEKLRAFAPEQFGVQTLSILEDIEQMRAEFASLGPERFLEWRESSAPTIRYRA